MAKPTNSINKIKDTGNTVHEIVPHKLTDGTYAVSLPTLTSDKTFGTAAFTSSDSYIPYGQTLMNTNPFGGKKLYINSMDNGMYSMDQRYFVTVTVHNKTVDGVSYPHVKDGAEITDDDYWVDSDIVSTVSNPHTIFDGSYEHGPVISKDQYLKVHIQFSNASDWTPSGSTSYYPGYPYGTYYLSFYYLNVPGSATWRCYNKYDAHTVGWHSGNFSYFNGSSSSVNSVILSSYDGGNYSRTCIEFIIMARSDGNTTLTDIDWKLDRPDLSWTSPLTTKFGSQKIYNKWTWGDQTSDNLQIFTNGNIETYTVYPKVNNGANIGTSSNKYSHVYCTYLGDQNNYISGAYITATNIGTAYFGSTNARIYATSDNTINIHGGNNGLVNIVGVTQSYTVRPTSNNAYDLGLSTLQWKDLYLTDAIKYSTTHTFSIPVSKTAGTYTLATTDDISTAISEAITNVLSTSV